MKTALKCLATLLAAALLIGACGKAEETTTQEAEDVSGRYYLVGTAEKASAVLNEDNYLRLKDDGKAIYQLTFDQLEYKWKLKDDGTLTLTLDGEKTQGTLEDGMIRIRLDSRDLVFVKGKSAAQKYIDEHADTILVPPTDGPTETPAPASTDAPVPATSGAGTETPSTERPGPFDPDIRFTAVDWNGNTVNENVFRDYVITMINFWEPWCGPCVAEMPELEQLYQDRDDLLILGVYWTEEGAAEVLSQTGVSYPVFLFDPVFQRYQTGYVPTTIFVDPGGHVIGQPYVGSRSYADWEQIIKTLIGQ